VVQIPIDSLLDARPVSTLTNGVVVPWTAGQGIDGNGGGNGFVTQGVATKLGYNGPALPSNGIFPAAKGLPEFDLYFSDSNPATSFQAHNVHANVVGTIQFPVPEATYSNIYLVLTDSENADMRSVLGAEMVANRPTKRQHGSQRHGRRSHANSDEGSDGHRDRQAV
jgi:hypothetical protein